MDDRSLRKGGVFTSRLQYWDFFAVIAILWNIGDILSVCAVALGKLYHYISPLIYAFFIAYLLFIPVSHMETALRKNERIAAIKPQRLRIATIFITQHIGAIALVAVIIASIYIMIGGQLSEKYRDK